MNRRSFLRVLAAIPIIRHIPLPKKIYGDELTLTANATLSPLAYKKYTDLNLGGIVILISSKVSTLKVTAEGGKELS